MDDGENFLVHSYRRADSLIFRVHGKFCPAATGDWRLESHSICVGCVAWWYVESHVGTFGEQSRHQHLMSSRVPLSSHNEVIDIYKSDSEPPFQERLVLL